MKLEIMAKKFVWRTRHKTQRNIVNHEQKLLQESKPSN